MTKRQLLEDIAISAKLSLSSLTNHNSPSGTNFVYKLPLHFIVEANSNDFTTLLSLIGFHSCYISALPVNGKGHFMHVITNKKPELPKLTNGSTKLKLIAGRSGKVALLEREVSIQEAPRYIVAYGYVRERNKCCWQQGHYLYDFECAKDKYLSYIK